jgi:membrane-associated protease RseP (regulator of RpoE activity)
MDDFTDGLLRNLETAVMLPLCLLSVFIIHELGHYAAARFLGLPVESVTFGRGKLLKTFRDVRGTIWSLHAWPLRAHVHIHNFEHNTSLSLRKRLFVVLAGPAANFLLPVVLFFAFFVLFGKPVVPTIVTSLEPDMPAYLAGLRPGDKILSIDGDPVRSMDDITAHTHPRPVKPLKIEYSREGITAEASVLPVWVRYKDIDGVNRAHGRIGLSTVQQAYDLKVVRSVAGTPVKSIKAARDALLAHMSERVQIGLWSMDGKVYVSVIDLSPSSNLHLADPEHRESKRIYLGSLRDNIYLRQSVSDSARDAMTRTGAMISHVALLPFNLFPIDREWITPDAVVSGQTSYIRARLYIFVFFASLCSCFIGLLNLVPFPRLDGSEALLMLGEAWKRRPLANREKAALLVFSLLFLYAAMFGANMGGLREYYTFQMQKVHAAER